MIDSLLLIQMRENSKTSMEINKHKNREQLETRWATQTIQPIWHFVAAFQNIAQNHLKNHKYQAIKAMKINMIHQRQMGQFVHHCAVIIQSHFKGYQQRKYYKQFLPIYRRFRTILSAVVAGWRVRQILKTKGMKNTRKKIIQLSQSGKHRQSRIMKRNFLYDFKDLQKKGKWVSIYKTDYAGKQNLKKQIKIINIKKSVPHRSQQNNKVEKVYQKENSNKGDKNRQQIANIAIETQIPIKASGKYEIPEDEFRGQQNEQKTVRQAKKKVVTKNNSKSSFQKKKTLRIDVPEQQKKSHNEKNKIQEDKQFQQLSHLTINLPIEVEEHDNIQVMKKTIKMKQISLAPTPKNSVKERLRYSDRKGISVTLMKLNGERMSEEPEKSDQLEKESSGQIVVGLSQTPVRDGLSQILEVYNGAYREKREEVNRNLLLMRKKTKFTGGNH